jgi:hypothetical protein
VTGVLVTTAATQSQSLVSLVHFQSLIQSLIMAAPAPPLPTLKALTRFDVKALMQAQWGDYFKLCSFPVHLLVISTPSRSNARLTVLLSEKSRFVGKRGDYYFIVAFFNHSYDYRIHFLISHETVVELNESSDAPPNRWRVPLYLCQEETQFTRKTPFLHYQDDEFNVPSGFALVRDPINPNRPSLDRAFDMRLELHRWFAKDTAFQDANPLDQSALDYARDAPHVKVPDQLCYFLLTKHMTSKRYLLWIKGEDALMRHKIYLRPKLGYRVCGMALAPTPGTAMACSKLHQFHQKNILRMKQIDWSWLYDPDAIALTDNFFDALEADATEDEPLDDAKTLLEKKAETLKITPMQQIFMGDIRSCAPGCLALLMNAAFGTDVQRARMPDIQRYYMNRILLEHKIDAEDIEDIMRPLSASTYNEQKPNRTWAEIKTQIKKASVDADIDLNDKKLHVTCEDMMKWDLCPHLQQALPVKPFEKSLRLRKDSFVKAKNTCQLDLELIREVRQRSTVRSGSLDWIQTPWAFTRVAAAGNQANPHRKIKKRNNPLGVVPEERAGEIAFEDEEQQGAAEEEEEKSQMA